MAPSVHNSTRSYLGYTLEFPSWVSPPLSYISSSLTLILLSSVPLSFGSSRNLLFCNLPPSVLRPDLRLDTPRDPCLHLPQGLVVETERDSTFSSPGTDYVPPSTVPSPTPSLDSTLSLRSCLTTRFSTWSPRGLQFPVFNHHRGWTGR